ncbi:hypothetical protein GCM10010232_40400 [Streptomyces amakusaensis]|uniref:Lipoprotein n=1 Tax=Streptomyces amakusaensis TaxID=67271 RepID=A0ABW0AIX1_9ACTN
MSVHRSRSLHLSLAAAVALLSLTGCSSGSSEERAAERPSPSAKPSQSSKPAAAATAALPVLDEDFPGTVVLRQGETRGGADLAFGPGKKDDSLAVTVNCQGKGTLQVTLRPVGASFPMTCVDGEVTTIQNHTVTSKSERAGTVSVDAHSGVRWSLTVSRGPAPEADLGPVSGEMEM